MTPDEHAAEAERLLTVAKEFATDTETLSGQALATAQVHALLATRPVALKPVINLGTTRRIKQPQPRILDYDRAMERAVNAFHDALPFGLHKAYTTRDALPWVKAAVDAFADTPPAASGTCWECTKGRHRACTGQDDPPPVGTGGTCSCTHPTSET